jgi:hypothetical protein
MAEKDERKDAEWLQLCEWMEINIFNYDITKEQRLQKKACLILKGLRRGQNVANNKNQTYGNYPDSIILMTFKANKNQILNAIRNKDFEDESNKMSYVCAIVRDKINDMYSRYLNAQKTQEKVESVDTSIMTHEGAEYKTNNTERKTNKRLEGLW